MGFAKVTIAGNIVRENDLRVSQGGTAFLNNAVAWDRWNKQGAKQTSYLEFTIFGPPAETFQKFVHRGEKVLLHGDLEEENWVDRETQKRRSKYKLIVNSFEFMSRGYQQQAQPATKQTQPEDFIQY